jgi:hypothetical protein
MGKQEVTALELKDCIKFAVETSKEKRLPFCVWGSHGIGKTEIVAQVAKEMNYNLVTVHLSTQDITDLIGIPFQKDGVQCWSTPKWLADANQKYKDTGIPNLFFLDEMNRGHQIVLKAMLPFLLDGTLHLHSIGPEDCVVAACNPPTDDYEVNEMNDKALIDRLGHVIFKPTRKEYLEYCVSKGIDNATMSVLKGNAKYTSIPASELGFEITPSRRAIFNVMSVIGKKDKTWIKNRANHIIECYLGAEFRDLWISEYIKGDDEVDLEVLINIDKNRDFIIEKITKKIDGLKTCAVDMVEKLTASIKSFIEERGTSLNKTDLAWIIEFYSLPIIPEEFPTSVILNNDFILKLIIKDKNANKLLGEFLKKRKIVSHAVEGW